MMQRVPAICRWAGWARRTLLAAEPARPNILLLVSHDPWHATIAALVNPHIHRLTSTAWCARAWPSRARCAPALRDKQHAWQRQVNDPALPKSAQE